MTQEGEIADSATSAFDETIDKNLASIPLRTHDRDAVDSRDEQQLIPRHFGLCIPLIQEEYHAA